MSLRARLTSLLLLAVLVIALVQITVTWRTASAETEAVFDGQMERIALSLTGGLASAVLADDALSPGAGAEDLIIQIWRADGAMLYRSRSARLLPQQAVLGFSTVQVGGAAYRVYSLQTRLQVIQIAQELASRRAAAGKLALRAALPVAALAPLLMLIVWWVVGQALAPIERVRRQVAERRAYDLAPLATAGLPSEVLPLVLEVNGLLERLTAAWDALQNFTGDAAHELRSPLAALRLQTQSLQRAEDPQARQVATERLLSGIDRATRLIEQMLALARQEGGRGNATPPVEVNLTRMALTAVDESEQEAQARGISLSMRSSPEESVLVLGYPQALTVLMRNLLENALRYTPENGRVDVAVEPESSGAGADEAGACLVVEDSGPGVSTAERQRVMDRFYRVAGASGHGSGLGLAIVKAVADRHLARVVLDESPALGGLRVTVMFSRVRDESRQEKLS